jgi:copper(I)-binding protein
MTRQPFFRLLTVATLAGGLLAMPALANEKPAMTTASPLQITGATVPAPLPNADALAAFMTLTNPSDKDITLVGAHSADFGIVELHDVVTENGRLAMKQLTSMTVPAHGKLLLAPRMTHIMLIKPKRQLKAGDTVPLTIDLGGGLAPLQLTVPVQTYKWK